MFMTTIGTAKVRLIAVGCAALLVAGCGASSGTEASNNTSAAGTSSSSVSSPDAGGQSESTAGPGSTSESASESASPSETGTTNGAVSASDAMESICAEAAQSEGALVVHNSTGEDVWNKEVAGFVQKFPGIKLSHGTTNPEDLVASIVTADQVGRAPETDLVGESIPDIQPLLDNNLVRNIDWEADGVASDQITMHGGTQLLLTQRIAGGLVYNTEKVKASDLPDTWADLVDPRWAGQIVVDPRGKYLSGLALVWGKDKAVEWYRNLMSVTKPQIVQGATNSLQRVISGEALISTSAHDAETWEQQSTGAPLDIKFLDIVPTSDHFAVILDKAKHPRAAECFLMWFYAGGGAEAQREFEYKSSAPRPEGLAPDAKLAVATDTDEANLQVATADEFAKLTQ